MRTRRLLLGVLLCTALRAQPVVTQTPNGPERIEEVGGYSISNSVETGYRFAAIDGNEDAYRASVNYGNGVRLLEARFRMDALDGEGRYFDELSLHTMGAGTDPYQFHTLRAEKSGWYRYDMQFRVNRYRNQLPALWQGERGMDAERRFQNHELTLLPGTPVELIFGFDRNKQDGPGFTTEGVPRNNGAFRRDNFIRLRTDLRRVNNNYRVGTNVRFLGLALTAFQAFDNYKEDTLYRDASGLPSATNNVLPVESLTRSEPYHGNTPVTTVALRTEKERRFGVHGRFVYAKGTRNWTLSENATALGTNTSTFRQTLIVGDASRVQASGDFTATWLPSAKWTVTNTSAVNSTRITGGAAVLEVTAFTEQLVDFEDLAVRHVTNATEASYRPVKQVGLYGAYRYSTRRVRNRTAFAFPDFSFEEPLTSVDNTIHSGAAGLRWMPVKGVRASLDVEVGRADQPLTPISEKNFHNEAARVQWRRRGLSVAGHFKNRVNNNPTALVSYSSESRSGGGQVSWARPDGRVTLDGGYVWVGIGSSAGIFNLFDFDDEAPGRTVYESNLHTVNFGGRFMPHERVTLYLGYTLARDVGNGATEVSLPDEFEAGYSAFSFDGEVYRVSFPLTYQSPQGRVSVQLTERLGWNFGWQLYRYAERFSGVQGYTAHVGYSSLRWSF